MNSVLGSDFNPAETVKRALRILDVGLLGSRGIALALSIFFAISAAGQSPAILLWEKGAPGSEGQTAEEKVRVNESGEHIVSGVHHPSITPYSPAKEKSTGVAVIIAPGGGHGELWMDHEGYGVAKWFSDHGVAAFVLKYRLARETGSTYSIEGTELADIQRAVRVVKSRSPEWNLDPQRVGVMGFSAGGELAALASTRYSSGSRGSTDPIERESSKPAFEALLYPAIPNHLNLTKETPPAFLVCGEDDRPDIARGLPELYLALKRAGVSAELHVYARTGHGFGVGDSNRNPVSNWPQLFLAWLGIEGFLKQK
jgi:acetyl esterase/lipase